MYVAELSFRKTRRRPAKADPVYAIEILIGSLLKNGQVLEPNTGPAETRVGFSTYVLLPETRALHRPFNDRWVNEALQALRKNGLERPRARIVGQVPGGASTDLCMRPRWRVLYTTFIQIESPVRCGDCFAPVPLYRLPERGTFSREHVLFWARAWQACDRLQMGCRVEERSTTRQISDPGSELSAWGRDLCRAISRLTRIPTYLYLYRGEAKNWSREKQRLCPVCGGPWLLEEDLHDLFDFKCDRCRLVSNIAWNAR